MKFEGFDKVGDVLLCSVYFSLCSIPVITVGASATAMHYALRRCIAGEGTVTRDFFTAFRREFRQATGIWLIYLLILAGLLGNFWLMSNWQGTLAVVLRAAMIVIAVVWLFSVSLVFPLLARFSNTTGAMLKNSLLLSIASPLRSLTAGALNLLPAALAVFLPNLFVLASIGWVLILNGVSGYLIQRLYASLFSRIEANVTAGETV